MYANPGVPEQNIPPHWHYITFGLSDLHGDGRVHEVTGPDTPSGMGFELTFRLKREPGETAPPTWPAAVLQRLAKYVFQTGNTLCVGDHVTYHTALDNSESRIQHMLMAADPQLPTAHTPLGTVAFIQVVGVCMEELRAAQHWNGTGVLEILRRLSAGPWLLTDMRRGESMLEQDPAAAEEVERGVAAEGSNLSGVNAVCSWDVLGAVTRKEKTGGVKFVLPSTGQTASQEDEDSDSSRNESCDSDSESAGVEATELQRSRRLDGVHLMFNLESGGLLPLAIRGRVQHGRHFTFQSALGDAAITLVAPSVTGTLVSGSRPYVARGPWLQMLVPEELAQEMTSSLDQLQNPSQMTLPKTFSWPEHHLSITITDNKP